ERTLGRTDLLSERCRGARWLEGLLRTLAHDAGLHPWVQRMARWGCRLHRLARDAERRQARLDGLPRLRITHRRRKRGGPRRVPGPGARSASPLRAGRREAPARAGASLSWLRVIA